MNFVKENVAFYLKDTNIENFFINEYMPLAPGDYVKVYIFASMYAGTTIPMSNEIIAKHLNLEEEDVLKAWNYWEKNSVIRKKNISRTNKYEYDVEFISLKQNFSQGIGDDIKPQDESSKLLESINLSDEKFAEMLSSIEYIAGRPLSGTENEEIMFWLSEFQMNPDLIVYCYSYCMSKKKKADFRYVTAVIRNWYDEDIKTVSDVEKHLSQNDKRFSQYRRVLKALGLNFRNSTEEEQRIIDIWYDEWHFSEDKILEACSKTSGISNPNINYINSILKNWHDGVTTKPKNKFAPKEAGKHLPNGPTNWFTFYDKIRVKNQVALDIRRKEVFNNIPRIKEIEDEIKVNNLAISKNLLGGSDNSKNKIEDLRQKIDKLNMEKAFLLTDNNFPQDHLDLIYDCKKCSDTGFTENGARCDCYNKE